MALEVLWQTSSLIAFRFWCVKWLGFLWRKPGGCLLSEQNDLNPKSYSCWQVWIHPHRPTSLSQTWLTYGNDSSTGSLAQTNLDNQSVCNVLRECSPGSTKATVAVYNGHLEVTNDKLRHSSSSLAQIEHSLVDVDGQNALSLPLLVVTLARRLPVHLWSLGEGWPASHKTKRL